MRKFKINVVLSLCSMWLLKRAEDPANRKRYSGDIRRNIEYFRERQVSEYADGEFVFPVIATDENQVKTYYAEVILNGIKILVPPGLTGDEVIIFHDLLLEFCINPNKSTAASFTKFYERLGKDKAESINSSLIILSPDIDPSQPNLFTTLVKGVIKPAEVEFSTDADENGNTVMNSRYIPAQKTTWDEIEEDD
jgi:hypothetical protein